MSDIGAGRITQQVDFRLWNAGVPGDHGSDTGLDIQCALLLGCTSLGISINLSKPRNKSVKWGNKTYMWVL